MEPETPTTTPPTLTEAERIQRQKMLTRLRGLLLDNDIYAVSMLYQFGRPTQIKGLGHKLATLLWDVVNSENAGEIAYLFPYPDGPDETYFGLPEVPDEADLDDEHAPLQLGTVRTDFLVYAISRLQLGDVAWVEGYLTGLVEAAEGFPELVADAQEYAAPQHVPVPGWGPFRDLLTTVVNGVGARSDGADAQPAPPQAAYDREGGC